MPKSCQHRPKNHFVKSMIDIMTVQVKSFRKMHNGFLFRFHAAKRCTHATLIPFIWKWSSEKGLGGRGRKQTCYVKYGLRTKENITNVSWFYGFTNCCNFYIKKGRVDYTWLRNCSVEVHCKFLININIWWSCLTLQNPWSKISTSTKLIYMNHRRTSFVFFFNISQ